MNDDLTAWFHCGRCASLFRAAGGEVADRRCAVCGEDPSVGMDPDGSQGPRKVPMTGRDPMLRVKMAEVEKPKIHKREVRRDKGRYFALKLIVVWAFLMVLLAVGGHFLWRDKPRENRTDLAGAVARGTLADEDVALLNRAYRKCIENLSGFLSAGTPEERNQFVRTPVDTARRMARYYQSHPFVNFDVTTIRGTGSGVIHLKDGRRLLETRWAVADGSSFDAVFFDEDGAWRLDWEEFVRYSDSPWSLFITGRGEAEGEFRLYARERLAEERSETGSLRIGLHAPVFGQPGEVNENSPEFLVPQDSVAGLRLKEALDALKAGRRIYSSTMPNADPEPMIRVRVKVRRSEGSLGRSFTIEEVKACHWLSIEDSGVSH